MLRASGDSASVSLPAFPRARPFWHAEGTRNVGGLPYGYGVDIDNAADPADVVAESGERPAALSPSRASDFMTCPLLYRFRVIDRIPEPPNHRDGARHAGPRGARAALRPAGRWSASLRPAADPLVEPEWLRLGARMTPVSPRLLSDDEEERARFLADAHAPP